MDYNGLINTWAFNKLKADKTRTQDPVEVYDVGITFDDETGMFDFYIEYDAGQEQDTDDVLNGEFGGEISLADFVNELKDLV